MSNKTQSEVAVSKAVAEIALKRAKELLHFSDLSTQSIVKIAMRAYIQGIRDAAESIK